MSFPLLNLPAELFLRIVDFLPFSSLKSFSACSRACRAAALRNLFGGARLSCDQSIHAFESGSLASYQQDVQHVNLAPGYASELSDKRGKTRPISFLAGLTLCRRLLRSLERFPSITKLTITVNRLEEYQNTLLIAMLNQIFQMPFYQNLKHFGLRTGRKSTGDSYDFDSNRVYNMGSEDFCGDDFRFFWESVRQYMNYPNRSRTFGIETDYPSWPQPDLQSVTIFCNQIEFRKTPSPKFDYKSGAFFFIASSAATLKRLHLHAKNKCSLNFKTPMLFLSQQPGEAILPLTFPQVKELWIDIEFDIDDSWLKQLVARFPNLEDLRVDACSYMNYTQVLGRDITPGSPIAFAYHEPWFGELQALENLRKATLPWPSQRKQWLLNERHLTGTPAPLLYNELQQLEEIVFFARPTAVHSRSESMKLIGRKTPGGDSNFHWRTYILPEAWNSQNDSGWYSENDYVADGYHTSCRCQSPRR